MHSLHQAYRDFTTNTAFDTDSWPGRGWQPPRTKGGWRDNSGPRLLLFASRSGHDAVGPPRVSTGVLAPSRAASPILSPLDHPLVGSSSRVYRPSTHARRFPRASHIAPPLRRRGRPRTPCSPCAQRSRRLGPKGGAPPGPSLCLVVVLVF